jgi:hypothetical protein
MSGVNSTQRVALPAWVAALIAALLGGLLPAAVLGWIALDRLVKRETSVPPGDFYARALQLAAQAITPGSALACLDALAGETVETACEKALFASPQATAAAVSYVSAQLALLAAGSDRSRGSDQSSETLLTSLRRALEADRFGIVAHVLAMRDGCTAKRCKALELLQNPARVRANLVAGTYDIHVKLHMAGWPSPTGRALATAPAAPPLAVDVAEPPAAPVANVKPPSNLFLPSAASIPPVSIMTSEPPAPQSAPPPPAATGSAEARTFPPTRNPPQGRQPAAPAAAAPGPPMQLGPNSQ